MTQNTDSAVTVPNLSPLPTNVPFNLIITTSRQQAEKLAKHYDLSALRFIDTLKLPAGGAKRGDALNEYLSTSGEHTITLVVTTGEPWVKALLLNMPGMAAMVWRTIETQLMGHRTNAQRNLLLVAGDFNGTVREAALKRELMDFCAGAPLPNNWKPPALARPVPQKKLVARDKAPRVETVAKPAPAPTFPKVAAAMTKPAASGADNAPAKRNVAPHKKAKPLDRSKKHKPQTGRGGNEALHDDLLLLCKNHYGPIDGDLAVTKIRQVMELHTGVVQGGSLEMVVAQLFRTLIGRSSRGYWGGFNLLQELMHSGGKGPEAVVRTLVSWIAAIPARDPQDKAIVMPMANGELLVRFNVVLQEQGEPAVAYSRTLPDTAA